MASGSIGNPLRWSEGEEVLKRDVSPHLIEADLLQELLRKRVSKSDVLDSEVGHIQQILALHLHREAGVGSAEVPGARIEGVGAVLSPVIGGKGLRESALPLRCSQEWQAVRLPRSCAGRYPGRRWRSRIPSNLCRV